MDIFFAPKLNFSLETLPMKSDDKKMFNIFFPFFHTLYNFFIYIVKYLFYIFFIVCLLSTEEPKRVVNQRILPKSFYKTFFGHNSQKSLKGHLYKADNFSGTEGVCFGEIPV